MTEEGKTSFSTLLQLRIYFIQAVLRPSKPLDQSCPQSTPAAWSGPEAAHVHRASGQRRQGEPVILLVVIPTAVALADANVPY